MKVLAVVVLCMILNPFLGADIVPTPGTLRVKPAFEKADLICKCFATSLQVLEEQPFGTGPKAVIRQRMRALVEVQDLYKSSMENNGSIFVDFEQTVAASGLAFSGLPGLWRGETALLFLTKSQSGVYVFADPFLGATPLSYIPQQPGAPSLAKLEGALAAVVRHSNSDDQLKALRLLQGFDDLSEDSLLSVKVLSRSKNPELGISAIGVLLKTKTPESVDLLKHYLDAYEGSTEPLSLTSVGGQLAQIRDVKALPSIEILSGSKYLSVRFGAMDAIRAMKNAKSIPTLIARLDDSNSTVQYVAVITLAEILGKFDGDFAPSAYLFDKKPEYYTGLWKRWWAEEGSRLYPPLPTK